ncbi:unnamed protein product [Brassica oleracea var. botrytis]|uniref:(rape) hypothetical protein n=1 Tax=Brassica napus TaxID=3708 RepID=A0A816U7S2_BRANA|nr:unnamed protein product [Brassica napus]
MRISCQLINETNSTMIKPSEKTRESPETKRASSSTDGETHLGF